MKITFDKNKKNLIFIKSKTFKLLDITTDDIFVIDDVACVQDDSKIVWSQQSYLQTQWTKDVKYLSEVTGDYNLIVEISQTQQFESGLVAKKIEKIRLMSFKTLSCDSKNELEVNGLEKRVLKTDTLTIIPDLVLINDDLLDPRLGESVGSGQLDSLLKQFKRLKNLENLDL
jgi:hypothetical protein